MVLKRRIQAFKSDQRGFSLIDVTLAALILGIAVVLMMMTMTKGSMSSSSETQSMQGLCRAQAQNVLQEIKSYSAGMGHVRYNPASGQIECRSGQKGDCPVPDFLDQEKLWGRGSGPQVMKPIIQHSTDKFTYRPYLLQLSYMNNLLALYNTQGTAICSQGVEVGKLTDLTTGKKISEGKELYQFEEAHQRTLIRIEPVRFSGRNFPGDVRCPSNLLVRPPSPAPLSMGDWEKGLVHVLGMNPVEFDLTNNNRLIQGSYDDVELKVTVTTFYRDPFEKVEGELPPERYCQVEQSFSYPQQRPVESPSIDPVDPSTLPELNTTCRDPLAPVDLDQKIQVTVSKPGSILLCRDRTETRPLFTATVPCTTQGCEKYDYGAPTPSPDFSDLGKSNGWKPCSEIQPECVASFSTTLSDTPAIGGNQTVLFNFNDIQKGCRVMVDILEVDSSLSFSEKTPNISPRQLTTNDIQTLWLDAKFQDEGLYYCESTDDCFPDMFVCDPDAPNQAAACPNRVCTSNANKCCCERDPNMEWVGGRCRPKAEPTPPPDDPGCRRCTKWGENWLGHSDCLHPNGILCFQRAEYTHNCEEWEPGEGPLCESDRAKENTCSAGCECPVACEENPI